MQRNGAPMTESQIFDLMKNEISFIPGSRVRFGRYPQNSDTPEPILWIVLGFRETKALLISESILDCQPFHQEGETVTWKYSTLRAWLNYDFLQTAFNNAFTLTRFYTVFAFFIANS